MQFNHLIKHSTIQAVISAAVIMPLLLGMYFVFEPSVVKGQGTTREFTVSQTIDGEISFFGAVADVTMAPSIPGITGGTGNGSTTFSVNTNNPDGYTVEIEFDNPTAAMQFTGGTGNIPNFGGTVELDFDSNVAANAAAFGFTIDGPNIADNFLDNTSSCGAGGGTSTSTCWWLGDTTGGTVVVDSDAAANQEEHTLYFRVHVNANPSPTLELGVYTATATLTAIDKP